MIPIALDPGQNRVLFVRRGATILVGTTLTEVRGSGGYVEAAEKFLQDNPTATTVVVELGEVIVAY